MCVCVCVRARAQYCTILMVSLHQRFSNFFQVGTTFIRMFYGPPHSWDYQTHYACPKQCSKHVFATEDPSFVAESRVGRVVNFIKCQSWERKFKDACCM